MVARFRCLLLGEPPSGVDSRTLLRHGIDGVIVPPSSAAVTRAFMPHALHLTKTTQHQLDLTHPSQLYFEGEPLFFAEQHATGPGGSTAFEIRRSEDRVVGRNISFPILRSDGIDGPALQALISSTLQRTIEETIRAGRENSMIVLAERETWTADDLRALDLGLIKGAAALPPRPATWHFPPSAFEQERTRR
jgi:hypothetical protein